MTWAPAHVRKYLCWARRIIEKVELESPGNPGDIKWQDAGAGNDDDDGGPAGLAVGETVILPALHHRLY